MQLFLEFLLEDFHPSLPLLNDDGTILFMDLARLELTDPRFPLGGTYSAIAPGCSFGETLLYVVEHDWMFIATEKLDYFARVMQSLGYPDAAC